MKGISNHLYFCAISSGGDGPLAKAKWLSILNHTINIHTHDSNLYPACIHGDLSEEPREWIEPGRFFFQIFLTYYIHKLSSTDIISVH